MTDGNFEPIPVSHAPDTTQEAFQGGLDRFEAFTQLANQKERAIYPLLRVFQAMRPDIYHKLKDPTQTPAFTFLGVGNGAMEVRLLAAIAAMRASSEGTLGNLDIFCEDPSEEEKAALEQRLRAVPIGRSTTEVLNLLGEKSNTSTAQVDLTHWLKEYKLEPIDSEFYMMPPSDIAVLSHVLYYLKNWNEQTIDDPEALTDPRRNPVLKMMHGIKERQGMAVFILQHPNSQTYLLRNQFNPEIHGKPEISSSDLYKVLHGNKIWTGGAVLPFALNMTDCFEGEVFSPNRRGKQILSFIFRRDWDEIQQITQKEIGRQVARITTENQATNNVLWPGFGYQGFMPHGPEIKGLKPHKYLELEDEMIFVDAKKQKEDWLSH